MDGFARAIAYANEAFNYEFTGTGDNPFVILPEVDGVVFVGTQTSQRLASVFDSYLDYFEFIDEAHEAGMGVAAVLGRPMHLPCDNKGVDCIIETERDERRPIKSIAEELTRYFRTRGL
jgi:hypothetical protein